MNNRNYKVVSTTILLNLCLSFLLLCKKLLNVLWLETKGLIILYFCGKGNWHLFAESLLIVSPEWNQDTGQHCNHLQLRIFWVQWLLAEFSSSDWRIRVPIILSYSSLTNGCFQLLEVTGHFLPSGSFHHFSLLL